MIYSSHDFEKTEFNLSRLIEPTQLDKQYHQGNFRFKREMFLWEFIGFERCINVAFEDETGACSAIIKLDHHFTQ